MISKVLERCGCQELMGASEDASAALAGKDLVDSADSKDFEHTPDNLRQ